MTYYNLNDYDYDLPTGLIAQEPLARRDSSRMMVLNRGEHSIINSTFNQLTSYLAPGDILVLNNTRVIPARLLGKVAGKNKEAELLLLHRADQDRWVCMVRPGRHLKPGSAVELPGGLEARIVGLAEEGLRLVEFESSEPFDHILAKYGKVPLPPYIKKEVDHTDQYQTIYALEDGSAAAPTAGFHFTDHTFEQLKNAGIDWAYITLHIGPGTFQPVKAEDIRNHVMHREYYRIEQAVANRLNQTRKNGGRIIAVGTTACRVLESVVNQEGQFKAANSSTSLYIYPGFSFRAVDAMLTNFHLPRSSLLMLVSAMAGYDLIMEAYNQAVREKYRFFSFGDCMLIL